MKTCLRHLTVVRCPLPEERLAISTQSIHRWKVHLMGYNYVADDTGLSSFVQLLLPLKHEKFAKFQVILTLQQFKVIQGHRSMCQCKAHYATSYSSLTLDVYPTIFEILTFKARKWLVFPTPHCLMPHSGWTPCDINVIYTSLKSAFNGLQFRRWQCGSIFIRLAVMASETREMSRFSKIIWPYSSSGSSKVIDLRVNGTPWNFWMKLTPQKLEGYVGYCMVKFHNPNFNRFSMIHLSDRQTDRRTDGRTGVGALSICCCCSARAKKSKLVFTTILYAA